MTDIKFGTDGWRAVIGSEFTDKNLIRISEASALWMRKNKLTKVVIGYDTRFRGDSFSQIVALVFAHYGITVYHDPDFVTTPMLSLATKDLNADLGVMITASHNPSEYNGFKLKSSFGGPLLQKELLEIENLIPEETSFKIDIKNFSYDHPLIHHSDLESIYLIRIKETFDLEELQKLAPTFAYDSMYGSGQKLIKKLFPAALHIHSDPNPGFGGVAPEPLFKNFGEMSKKIATSSILQAGFANDGDGDRVGMVDEKGRNIDSHHVLLLTLYYLVKYKKMSGKVVVSAAASEKIAHLASYFGLECQFTKIGFKHIAPIILKEDVLLGGEEAGGHFIKGHIPERDGIWLILILLEMIDETGKSLSSLIHEIYEIVGSFSYERRDLHLSEEKKQAIMKNCKDGLYSTIAKRKVKEVMTVDGFRYFFESDEWLMIRPSGTEPVLRLYAQSNTKNNVDKLLDQAMEFLLKD